MPLLEVNNLATHFFSDEGLVRAVDDISFTVERGEVLCLVGESGSGKSVASLSLLGLIEDPPGRVVAGEVLFQPDADDEAEDLARATERRMRAIRGNRIAMVFQDPTTSLNPYMKVGRQLVEVLEIHRQLRGAQARSEAIEMLAQVGMPAPKARYEAYPHQLSGGMRQRVMIAMALLCRPDLLIADEPTTALDVTVQAQILSLIEQRKRSLGLAMMLITHDLGVVARMADRVAVMYAGRIVELGSAAAVLSRPQHPYSRGLRASLPRVDEANAAGDERRRLRVIAGAPPAADALPSGCAFHPRCPHALQRCRELIPEPRDVQLQGSAHRVSCHRDAAELDRGEEP